MANISKTFPPKFSKSITYPAIYNLDEYDIPNEFDITSGAGVYFDIQFPGYNLNGTPTLTYGKHLFRVFVYQPTPELSLQGYERPGSLPKLKTGSRILFEFKDSAGNVLLSDIIPNANPQGFAGYVWIKQDPLRTYEDIQEGYGKITIVAKTDINDQNWRNRYNLRFTHPINLNLFDANNIAYQNPSPIVFQNSTSSLLQNTNVQEEKIENDQEDSFICFAQISCSRMKTYSGEVKAVTTSIMVSGSGINNFETLGDWSLTSASYENEIDSDYSAGINTISEKFRMQIPTTILQENGQNGNKVRFRLKFKNPLGEVAKDINNPAEDYFIDYPSHNTWLDFDGNTLLSGTSMQQTVWDDEIANTSEGQFSFANVVYSAPSGSGGQQFKSGTGQKGLKSSYDGSGEGTRGG